MAFERIEELNKGRVIEPQDGDEQGFLQETAEDIKQGFLGVREQLFSAGERIVETAAEEDLTIGEKIRGGGAAAFRGGARAFEEGVLTIGKIFLTQAGEDKVEEMVGVAAEKVAQNKAVQELIRDYESLSPDTRREVDNALGFAEGLADIATFGIAGKLSRPVARQALKVVEEAKRRTQGATSKFIRKPSESLVRTTSQKIRSFHSNLKPSNKQQAIDSLHRSYETAFVENKTAINKALSKEARKQSSRKKKVTPADLTRRLAEEGYTPVVDGKLADFSHVVDDLSNRQTRIAEKMGDLLVTFPQRTTLDGLKTRSKQSLRNSPLAGADLNKSLREMDRFFDSFKTKYGDDLSATDLNQIRLEMNKRTKAFKGEIFEQDTADAVADAVRGRIDEIAESGLVREANARIGELLSMQKTASVLNFQSIDVGVMGSQLGRYIGATALGASGIATGSGSLVIAGIAAHFGGEAFAQMLRQQKFRPDIRNKIIESVKQDADVVDQLIDQTEGANKAFLERVLLPEPPIRQPATRAISGPLSPARKQELIDQIEAQTTRTDMQKVIQQQASRFKSRETFLKAVNNNPAWRKKIESAGTTPESIADIVFDRINTRGSNLAPGATPKTMNNIPPELESLAQEARKFDNAEEFVRSLKKNPDFAFHQTDESSAAKIFKEGFRTGEELGVGEKRASVFAFPARDSELRGVVYIRDKTQRGTEVPLNIKGLKIKDETTRKFLSDEELAESLTEPVPKGFDGVLKKYGNGLKELKLTKEAANKAKFNPADFFNRAKGGEK